MSFLNAFSSSGRYGKLTVFHPTLCNLWPSETAHRQVKVLVSKASAPEFNPQSLRPGEREACTWSPSDKRPLWLIGNNKQVVKTEPTLQTPLRESQTRNPGNQCRMPVCACTLGVCCLFWLLTLYRNPRRLYKTLWITVHHTPSEREPKI